MKKTKTKLNTKRIVLVILIGIILIGLIIVLLKPKEVKKEVEKVEILDQVENYIIYDTATTYQKDLFKELKELLENNNDEEKHAELIGKLFLADLFTLKTKVSKNDIGGIQFVYEPYRESFENKVKDTLYHTVESNIYGDRKQELPNVTNVEIENIKEATYSYEQKKASKAYIITYTINYEKDMGYQQEVTLTVISNDDKLEIAKMEK